MWQLGWVFLWMWTEDLDHSLFLCGHKHNWSLSNWPLACPDHMGHCERRMEPPALLAMLPDSLSGPAPWRRSVALHRQLVVSPIHWVSKGQCQIHLVSFCLASLCSHRLALCSSGPPKLGLDCLASHQHLWLSPLQNKQEFSPISQHLYHVVTMPTHYQTTITDPSQITS